MESGSQEGSTSGRAMEHDGGNWNIGGEMGRAERAGQDIGERYGSMGVRGPINLDFNFNP